MIKKLVVGILLSIVVISSALFFGCTSTLQDIIPQQEERFVAVFEQTIDSYTGCKILVDKETKIMYLFVTGGSRGGLTVMVDAEGKPLIYNEEFD